MSACVKAVGLVSSDATFITWHGARYNMRW